MMKLNRLKSLTIKARGDYMLPKYLCYLIINLKDSDDASKVNYLKQLTEHYFRVKGYYKKYADLASQIDAEIKKEYERRYPLNEQCLESVH